MLKTFFTGIGANLVFVAAGVFKQFLLTSSLSVTDFGGFGSMVAVASLMMTIVPFPAYLDVMIRGFSAPPRATARRRRLLLTTQHELLRLTALVGVFLVGAWLFAVVTGQGSAVVSLSAVLVLLVIQYSTAALDLGLRMQQAHRRLASFMAVRSVPTLLLLLILDVGAPWHVALIDLIAAAVTMAVFGRPFQRWPGRDRIRRLRTRFSREHMTLWLARIAQFTTSSLSRILVPLLFDGQTTGFFFFALIAQLPCSLFLSVNTQLFGHTLARLRPGEWRIAMRAQFFFALPNVVYAAVAVAAIGHWATVLGFVPSLVKYQPAGPLVVAAVVLGAVLATDATEYLLRSRGLSRLLLGYSVASSVAQAAVIYVVATLRHPLAEALLGCALTQAILLAGFSAYSFYRVLGRGDAG